MKRKVAPSFETRVLEAPVFRGDSSSCRGRWETPAMRRLAASAAENGVSVHADAEATS